MRQRIADLWASDLMGLFLVASFVGWTLALGLVLGLMVMQ